MHLEELASTHVNCNVVSRELPGVKVQPVVGDLNLVAINDLLLENTISISKTVAPGGEVERCKTVEEASSQSAETTVAQSCVVLLADDILDSEAKIGKTSYRAALGK
jgi:hypothetical protein